MALEKLDLEHIPPEYQVYAAFFRDVSNADFLHAQLLSRNSEFEYAFIDASSVISRLHLLSAVYSALNVLLDGTLRTPNVHSEIVVSMNTSNNVHTVLGPSLELLVRADRPRLQMRIGDGASPPARQKT